MHGYAWMDASLSTNTCSIAQVAIAVVDPSTTWGCFRPANIGIIQEQICLFRMVETRSHAQSSAPPTCKRR